MKKYILLFFTAAFFFALSGCDGDRNTTEAGQTQQQEQSAGQSPSQQTQASNQLAADASQKTASGKWKANLETTQGIESMMEMVGSFTGKDADLKHCAKLKQVLLATFNRILQQCTMQGPAHDALHEYLMPLKEKIDGLSITDTEECLQNVRQISEYLSTYYEKFE